MNIKEALAQLNVSDDSQWTADGLPRIDAIETLTGEKGVKREDVTNADPSFMRASAAEQVAPADPAETDASDPDADPAPKVQEAPVEAPVQPEAQAPEADASATGEALDKPEPGPAPELAPAPAVATVVAAPVDIMAPASVADPVQYKDPAAGPATMARLQDELAERTEEMLEAQRVRERAKIEADRLANEVNALNRRIEVLVKADPNHGTAGVRAYLASQNKLRIARAAGLQKFIKATGIHPADVAKAVDPRAPIDRAMNVRKPARAGARPIYPAQARI